MTVYYRPIAMTDPARPEGALALAGTSCWFTSVERLERGSPARIVDLDAVPQDVLDRLTSMRAPVAGISLDRPRIMGILNVTPDSFSDGGLFNRPELALEHAGALLSGGADILDIGGESTRPGAVEVVESEEISRTAPVVAAIRARTDIPLSIDTRNAAVAEAAIAAGASLINDVAALGHDQSMAGVVARSGLPVILMHAQGKPATMQNDPYYVNVILDVYDFLEERIEFAMGAGIPRHLIVVDPGIGFGKTLQHNVTILRNLTLYHSLGCALLLGASRKRFIGTIGKAEGARDRMPGSVAVALHGVTQGVHILRVHDTVETRQALSLQQAMIGTD
ncbi:MAG: dihydropteroate synthase [Rhodobacterales bacterium]|nr:dihydropteroate synthase [Rhodobacterales bacterium]